MRQHGWDTRLFDYIESHRNTPFQWGVHDCCLFTANAVEIATQKWAHRIWQYDAMKGDIVLSDAMVVSGTDFAAGLRGYQTEQEAYAVMSRYGSMQAMVTALLGAEPIHPAFAQRGDVLLAMHPETNQETLGVCMGVHAAMPGANGLVFPRLAAARFAWRI